MPASIGRAHWSRNTCGLGCSPGATIDSSDHRSMSEFSSGVPVSAKVTRAGSRRIAAYVFAWWFLTNCASSSTAADHRTERNCSASIRATA